MFVCAARGKPTTEKGGSLCSGLAHCQVRIRSLRTVTSRFVLLLHTVAMAHSRMIHIESTRTVTNRFVLILRLRTVAMDPSRMIHIKSIRTVTNRYVLLLHKVALEQFQVNVLAFRKRFFLALFLPFSKTYPNFMSSFKTSQLVSLTLTCTRCAGLK